MLDRAVHENDDGGTATALPAAPTSRSRAAVRIAEVLPVVLLLVSFADDALVAPSMIAAELAFGWWALPITFPVLVGVAVASALATRWALSVAPLRLGRRLSERFERLRSSRAGSRLLRTVNSLAVVAVCSVALGPPALVLLLSAPGAGPGPASASAGISRRAAVVAGVAYGVALWLGYGALASAITVAT